MPTCNLFNDEHSMFLLFVVLRDKAEGRLFGNGLLLIANDNGCFLDFHISDAFPTLNVFSVF